MVHFTETSRCQTLPDHEMIATVPQVLLHQIGDKLFIFYTARDENWIRDPRQIGA